jgi:4-azaleucine resistance transporter AzlC
VSDAPVTFTWRGARAGARRVLPIVVGDFAFGVVLGVVARQTGLSLDATLLMSGLVFAGAAQIVALGLWATPLPVVSLILATLVVNLRHLLMGASLRPWFAHLRSTQAYGSVFFMVDETWALTMREFAGGGRDAAFLLGSGVTLWAAWVSSAAVGYLAGAAIQDPAQWGLDFLFTAVFIALLLGLWRGKSDLLPWVVAAVVAIAAATWLPGKWYILLGGLAGSLTGALRDAR